MYAGWVNELFNLVQDNSEHMPAVQKNDFPAAGMIDFQRDRIRTWCDIRKDSTWNSLFTNVVSTQIASFQNCLLDGDKIVFFKLKIQNYIVYVIANDKMNNLGL